MENSQTIEQPTKETTKGKLVPVFQKPGTFWVDEQGISIPFNRVNKSERIKEKYSERIVRDAIKASNALTELHKLILETEAKVMEAVKKEGKKTTVKGSFTFYVYNKSVRIQVKNNDTVKFDEAMIATARVKLDEFLSDSITTTEDIVRQLINMAFHNTGDGLDSKKVLSICKFRSKIKDKRFIEAIDLIEESQIVDSSKKYYKVDVKNEAGQYQNINLQFSNV